MPAQKECGGGCGCGGGCCASGGGARRSGPLEALNTCARAAPPPARRSGGGVDEEGEALVLPPGYMHETYTDPALGAGCSASATFTLSAPLGARCLRAFLPRLAASHLQRDLGGVREAWAPMATLRAPGEVPPVRFGPLSLVTGEAQACRGTVPHGDPTRHPTIIPES